MAQIPQDEELRLQTTHSLGLLDTEPEAEFDEIVELATTLCGVPIGLVTLIDAKRQFHKSRIGIDIAEVPREYAFCNYTIQQDNVLVVEDATKDSRFATNPFVTSEPNIRFYAGAPLRMDNGTNVGALCVIDSVPHVFTDEQRRALEILGKQISLRMELRRRQLELEKTAQELHLSRESFRAFANAMPVEAYLKAADGKIVFYNRQLADRFKVSEDEWIGKTSYDIWPLETADQIVMEDRHVMRTRRPAESYVELPLENGGISYRKNIKVPCVQTDGEVMLACISIDMTADLEREGRLQQLQDELEIANRKLQTLSLTDELTDLRNRRSYDIRLAEEIAVAKRRKQPLTLVMIDLDDFKKINDTFGHSMGDAVLRQSASLLMASKRTEDVAFRYGGEEFALLLIDSDSDAAVIVCERLLRMMQDAEWGSHPITASLGIATYDGEESAESLTHRADLALYAAKRAGKARCVVYSPEMK